MRRSAPSPPWPDGTYVVCEALSQVVAGTNYFFKVRVSTADAPPEYVHLRIFVDLFGNPAALAGLLKGDAAAGELSYF